MRYISIIQRFAPLQFGKTYKEKMLYDRFQDCLEKINQDGMMVLNDFTFFHNYIDHGVKSQITKQNVLYIFVHIQLLVFTLLLISGLKIGIISLVFITTLILGQYLLCWVLTNIDKQNIFVHKIFEWSKIITDDLDLMNYLVLDSGDLSSISVPFSEGKYANLWLKEMSTSMDMDWENIAIELLPGDSFLVPKVRVSLGGIKKSIQDAESYGFTDGSDSPIPNRLLKMLLLFSRKKSIRFFGDAEEKEKIDKAVKQLVTHLELLFGKRENPPIVFNEEDKEWETVVNVVDRSNTDRNNIKQSMDIFVKIMNSYTGNNRQL